MQSLQLRQDTLIEIATFLVRRWSSKENVIVEISEKMETRTRLSENKVILLPIEKYFGSDFEKYRQYRTTLWYESMRIKFCKKILSNDHAFGFILNAIETRRIELLGRKIWQGMDEEIIFNYAYAWNYRPHLSSIYGKARIVEAFYQYFLLGSLKGEIQPSYFNKIVKATDYAKEILNQSIENNYDTEWLEKKIPQIINILGIDSLITIPITIPKLGPDIAIIAEQLMKTIALLTKTRKDLGKVDPHSTIKGETVAKEYKFLLEENKKSENKGLGVEFIGVQIPSSTKVDETTIYDLDLINSLKTKFREWKSGWKEEHDSSGDEFDEETYIEGHNPFFTDKKKTIKSRIVILLDHSSSISSEQIEYKKATLALCEVLAYLKVKFAVYAFSTEQKSVICWLVKAENMKWSNVSAKRLAQIAANGGTPLAEVYDKMHPIVNSKKPDIFLTLTDGEPSDPDAVRAMIKSYKQIGMRMVALGLGPNTTRATTIASNLKRLGYEKTLAVSRLKDIPSKVINVLSSQ